MLSEAKEIIPLPRLHLRKREFAKVLSAAMNSKALTQRALATLMKKEPSYISKVLNCKINLTLETICEFEQALEVDLIESPYRVMSKHSLGSEIPLETLPTFLKLYFIQPQDNQSQTGLFFYSY